MGTMFEIVREIRPEIPVETTFCVRCDQGLTYIKTIMRGSITSEVFSEAALKPCPRSPDGKHLAQISE